MPAFSSGSPPVTATPSSIPCRFLRNLSSSSSAITSRSRSGRASDALWQKGQRRSQPAVNIVQATLPG